MGLDLTDADLPVLEPEGRIALHLWNVMGGEIAWTALPLLAEIHGVDDLELLIDWLVALRTARTPKPERPAHGDR